MIEGVDDATFFSLVAKLNDGLQLLQRQRWGDDLSKEELKRLRNEIVEVLSAWGLRLPLKGFLASRMVTRRPGPVSRYLGVDHTVDELVDLVLRLIQMATAQEGYSRVRGIVISNPDRLGVIDDSLVGYVLELLGRLWLREVIGGKWEAVLPKVWSVREDAKNRVLEVDAVTQERRGVEMHLSMCEIQRQLHEDDLRLVPEKVRGLQDLFRTGPDAGTTRKVFIDEVVLMSFGNGPIPERGWANLEVQLSRLGVRAPQVYGLDDIRRECEKNKQIANGYLRSLKYLAGKGLIGP